MKTLIAAILLTSLMAAPSFAQHYYGYQAPADSSPASPNYTGSGY